MKVPARNVAWLLPFALTACAHLPFHKAKEPAQPVAPPVTSTAPRPETSPMELPPSASTIPTQPLPTINTSTPTKPAKPPTRRRRSSPAQAPAQASNGAPSVSAIGQLSSGEAPDLRQETKNSLSATERGLNGVNRKLSDQEQKTAAQIREFLKQAHTALNSGDLDGARTLAAKAKVLLAELTQ